MAYTKEELREILQKDFIEDPFAFTSGRRNNDMVDSMCICFALDEEWTEMYAKHADNYVEHSDHAPNSQNGLPFNYFDIFLKEHYERVKKWLEDKENISGYNRGETDIMDYAINY